MEAIQFLLQKYKILQDAFVYDDVCPTIVVQ